MAEHILEVKDIKVRYASLLVIQGLSLNVDPGETVCVVGANGAGKSTFLKAIMGSVRVFDGEILFFG
ncbi:MAG: ATP-binding cassette domain-containing protein, partial [Deltaproteobacteria bacterium]|nr:ATP-binding cassette domain-containing protein [Deltaproteobacteria bacterium]